jgi:hypothetical protein
MLRRAWDGFWLVAIQQRACMGTAMLAAPVTDASHLQRHIAAGRGQNIDRHKHGDTQYVAATMQRHALAPVLAAVALCLLSAAALARKIDPPKPQQLTRNVPASGTMIAKSGSRKMLEGGHAAGARHGQLQCSPAGCNITHLGFICCAC